MVSHSQYDDYKFEPKFEITQQDLEEVPDVDRICSDSQFCVYDYVVTHDSAYGEQTKKSEAMAQNMHQDISEKVIKQSIEWIKRLTHYPSDNSLSGTTKTDEWSQDGEPLLARYYC